jgi:flagellar hook-associated protein 2
MAITFGGISSGIDSKAIIEASIAAQRVPIDKLAQRKSAYSSQISNLGKLASKLGELQKMAEDMGKTSNVLAYELGLGDEDILGATADGSASAGRYEVEITRLAAAEKNRSAAFASNFSEVKAGTITIETAGDTAIDVTIEAGDTLEDVVDRINASGAEVDAAIVSDGTSRYLQVTAAETGHVIGGAADDAIKITENYTGSTGGELGLAQVVQARNATLKVDGLTAESRSNTPSDIVPGMQLDLKKEGTSSLGVSPDKSGTISKIKAFVDLTNEVLDLVRNGTRTAEGARSIDNDPTLERLGSEIRNVVLRTVDGLATNANSLSRIGIETTTNGKLEIDNDRLEEALDKDIRGVGKLFTTTDKGLSDVLAGLLDRYTDGVDGLIGNRKKALNGRVDQLDAQIVRMESRLERTQTTLQRQFSAMEQALSAYQTQGKALTSMLFGG